MITGKKLIAALQARSHLLRSFLLVLLLSALSAGSLHAQNFTGKFTLPIEVRWRGVTLPSGEYKFRLDAYASHMVILQSPNGSRMHLRVDYIEMLRTEAKSQLLLTKVEQTPTVNILYIADLHTAFCFTVPTKYQVDAKIIAQEKDPETLLRVPVVYYGK